MSRHLNPRKKFRHSRADEESGYITLRDGYATAIFQRPDGKFDVWGDVPEGQGAFIGTYKGLNGAEAAFRANEKVMAAFSRRARAAFDASRWRQSPMFSLRSNPETIRVGDVVRMKYRDGTMTVRVTGVRIVRPGHTDYDAIFISTTEPVEDKPGDRLHIVMSDDEQNYEVLR